MYRSRHRRPGRPILAVWLLGLGAALAAVWSIGTEHPGSPPLTEPARWAEWWGSRDPIDAAAGVAHLLAMAAIAYLIVVTAAMLLAAVVARRSGQWTTRRRARAVMRGVGRLAPKFVLGITASAVFAAPTAAGATTWVRSPAPSAPNGPGATMERLTAEPTSPGTTGRSATSGQLDPATSTTGRAEHVPAEPTATVPARPDTWLPWAAPVDGGPRTGTETPALAETIVGSTAPRRREVVVRAGDHLWGIAESEMSRRLGRAATTSEVERYWRMLIEANRGRLAQRDDPDLIFPGQTFVLP